MVACGDLAVEVGFEQLSEVQEEILWLCEVAYVPVIWAAQILEGEVALKNAISPDGTVFVPPRPSRFSPFTEDDR